MEIYRLTLLSDELLMVINQLMAQLSSDLKVITFEELEYIVNSENTMVIVAQETVIVGTLTMLIIQTPSGRKMLIEDVVVDAQYRGKGIGEKLLQFALDYALENKIKKIDLTTSPKRVSANQLYQKLGFVKRVTNVYRWQTV